jgi:methyl-accepting chemotaxis protein
MNGRTADTPMAVFNAGTTDLTAIILFVVDATRPFSVPTSMPGAAVAVAQLSPPLSPREREVEALVNKAAALIDAKGKAAFSEFRTKGTEWFHGDAYLFAYDLKDNVLLNPAFPAREGTNVSGQKDSTGKLFHDAIIRTAESKGSGWVDYMFPKPGQTQPSQKWAFAKAVKIDGVPGLVASGFYP